MSTIPRSFTILGPGTSIAGPSSGGSTDNAIMRWDGTGGRTAQNSVIIVADTTGAMSGWTTGAGLTFHGGGTLTGASGALTLTGSGTNQNITLTPSGTGYGILTKTALGTTSTDGWVVENTTDAAAGAQQIGPRIGSWGKGWKTDATAASVVVGMGIETLPVQGAAAPTATLNFFSKIGASAVTYPMTLTSAGVGTFTGILRGLNLEATNTSGYIGITSRMSIHVGGSDGLMSLEPWAAAGNVTIGIGGATSAYPALKRSAAVLAFRLADDSADAAITAGAGTFSGSLVTTAVGNAMGGAISSGSTGLILNDSTTGVSSLRIPHGTAPTSPVNGDIWTTTAGLFVRINGATVGPLT